MKREPITNELSLLVDRRTRGERNELNDTTRKPAGKSQRWDIFFRSTGLVSSTG